MKKENNHLKFLASFKTHYQIQEYLDKLKYNSDGDICKSPKRVFYERKAHCLEGAIFAAAAMMLSFEEEPLLVDMLPKIKGGKPRDDDHVIALFKKGKCLGAISKTNTPFLGYREPVYKTSREIIMSYFYFYFNTAGEKTLRKYSPPFNLRRIDKHDWINTEENMDFLIEKLDSIPHYNILEERMETELVKANQKMRKACFLYSDKEGLFKI